jgi:hypothetical protein
MTVTQGRHPAWLARSQRTAEREQALARLHWRSVRDGVGRELRIYRWAGYGGFQRAVT